MEHWNAFHNLVENPFGETPNTRFFYYSDQHRFALEKLAWMIAEGKGFGLLTGDVGTGKTLLCRRLLKSVREKANTALILHPMLGAVELLVTILDEFKVKRDHVAGTSFKAHLDLLNDFLISESQAGRRSILLFDDAQALPMESLELVRLLSNFETESQKLLHIIFVGQPELVQKLNTPELKQLGQRIAVQPVLAPLDEANMSAYIAHRIEKAGGTNFLRFHPKALKRIFEATGGNPRLVNRYCEAAIAEAQKQRVRLIDVSIMKAILPQSARQSRSFFSFSKTTGTSKE